MKTTFVVSMKLLHLLHSTMQLSSHWPVAAAVVVVLPLSVAEFVDAPLECSASLDLVVGRRCLVSFPYSAFTVRR